MLAKQCNLKILNLINGRYKYGTGTFLKVVMKCWDILIFFTDFSFLCFSGTLSLLRLIMNLPFGILLKMLSTVPYVLPVIIFFIRNTTEGTLQASSQIETLLSGLKFELQGTQNWSWIMVFVSPAYVYIGLALVKCSNDGGHRFL